MSDEGSTGPLSKQCFACGTVFMWRGNKVRATPSPHLEAHIQAFEEYGMTHSSDAGAILAGRCLLERNQALAGVLLEGCEDALVPVLEAIAEGLADEALLDAEPELCSALARVASDSPSPTSAWVDAWCSELMQAFAQRCAARLQSVASGRVMPLDMLRELATLSGDMAEEHKRLKGLRTRALEACEVQDGKA